jgi:FkbM family methyltransferase
MSKRSFISYAQNREDEVISNALRGVRGGFYIDVGAADPNELSVSRHFYSCGWHGINIEPLPNYYDALVEHRPRDINLQLAISNKCEHVSFYNVGDVGLSTLVKDLAIGQKDYEVGEFKVYTETLMEAVGKYLPPIVHWMKIDVEGYEREVLEGWDFSKLRPWIVVIEAINPITRVENWMEWEPLMIAGGYVPALFDGLNKFYFAKEQIRVGCKIKLVKQFTGE